MLEEAIGTCLLITINTKELSMYRTGVMGFGFSQIYQE